MRPLAELSTKGIRGLLFDIDDTPEPSLLVGYAMGLPADNVLVQIQLRPLNIRG